MVESPIEEEGQGTPTGESGTALWAVVQGCLVPDCPVVQLSWTLLGAAAIDRDSNRVVTAPFDELAESDFDEDQDDNDELEPDELPEPSVHEAPRADADATLESRGVTRHANDARETQTPSTPRPTSPGTTPPPLLKASVRVTTGSVPAVGPPPTPMALKSAAATLPRIPPPLPKPVTGSVLSVDNAAQSGRTLRQPPIELPPAAPPMPVAPPVPVAPSTFIAESARSVQQKPADDLAALVQELISAEANPAAGKAPELRTSRQHWFAEIFDETWLRTLPENTGRRTLREVQFVVESLRLQRNASVLDMACGHGSHSLELSARGYQVTGVDLSRVFLERAHRESQRRNLTPRFMVGDMRDVSFESEFDAAICMNTSFGFFDDVTNYGIVTSIFRALRPGGQFLLETVNRDYITAHVPRRRWWDNADLIIMEEVDFDAPSSRLQSLRTLVDGRQRPWEQHISIRLYGVHELCGMLAMAGFEIVEVSGDIAHRGSYLGAENRSVILSARKPA